MREYWNFPKGPKLEDLPDARWYGWTSHVPKWEDEETGEIEYGSTTYINKLAMLLWGGTLGVMSSVVFYEDELQMLERQGKLRLADVFEVKYEVAVMSFREKLKELEAKHGT